MIGLKIQNPKSKGYSSQQIYGYLVQRGYGRGEVSEALKFSSSSSGQITSPSQKSTFLPILIIGGVILALIGSILWVVFLDKDTNLPTIVKNVDKTKNLIDSEGNKKGETNTKIEAKTGVVSDCGEMNCFEERFFQCQPATLTSKLRDNIVYHYEILGPKNGLCEVRSKFIANLNPKWIGKEMDCKYDNTQNFEQAIQDMSRCQGTLYDLMTSS